MTKLTTLVVALGAAAIMLVSMLPSGSGSPNATPITMQELHALAHLEGLAIQDYQDESLVYPTLAKE
jgi:uncharacterized membrane protein YgdD (TMEM256/DUF423 family)